MAYKQLTCLGSGYFGEVWLEHDDALDRDCASKYLNPARLQPGIDVYAEARAMITATHDHVVSVYSADDVGGTPVIRMEYLPDGSVEDRYGGHPLPVGEAVRVLEDACRGVQHLHSVGLLHRDIKPGNLLLTATGGVKVSDFGLSCSQSATAAAPPWNYASHTPPECAASGTGITTVEGDVYALGVTGYRLLNGDAMTTPSAGATTLMSLIAAGKFPDRSRWQPYVHPKLRKVIKKALHTDPSRRYLSAAAFRHALEGARPKVSWAPITSPPGDSWQGVAADGTAWRAVVEPRTTAGYRFTIERRLPGRAWRRQAADCAETADREEALSHATAILGAVAG